MEPAEPAGTEFHRRRLGGFPGIVKRFTMDMRH